MKSMAYQSYRSSKIHPQKFALWISFASIMMMFGAFTSAYIVRQSAGNWLEFKVPDLFFLSTFLILASSFALHTSYRSFLNGKERLYKGLLFVTFVLGISFLACQYMGWQKLFSIGIDLKGNPSGSFLYVITFVHAAHIVGGIGCLIVAMLHAFTLPYKVTKHRKHRFELVVQYWHFVDFLWVYLLFFLLLTR